MSFNSRKVDSVNNGNLTTDETKLQLEEYLIKLIDLVPNLKQQQQTNNGSSSNADSSSTSINYLEQLSNLDLNSKEISDLQILQSVLDYIGDLRAEIVCADQSS